MQIRKITIISQHNDNVFEVGKNGVASIIDNTVEFENDLKFVYDVYGMDNKLLTELINCPVQVDYNVND